MGLKNLLRSGKTTTESTPGNATPAMSEVDFVPPPSRFDRSGRGSLAPSIAPSMRSTYLDDIRHEVKINWLYQQQMSHMWISDTSGETEGVLIRKARSQYLACPPDFIDSIFAQGCMVLNLPCAMTVNSRIVKTFLVWTPDAVDVPIGGGLRVQILPTMEDLQYAKKAHSAAFIAQDGLLVVWDDDADNIFKRAKHIETELVDLVWNTKVPADNYNEKKEAAVEVEDLDEENGAPTPEHRHTNLIGAVLVALTMALIIVMLGTAFRLITFEVAVTQAYLPILFVLLVPIQVFFALFFAQSVVSGMFQIFGPIKQVTENSKFYSAIKPRRLQTRDLPHVTVQCPVYKEGLEGVIMPTIKSIKAAITTYELQGGSANIFINDDGMQLISDEERQARIDYYADNSIGWTARPKQGDDGFVRRGKFKKASNMNYALMLSCNVEEKLSRVHRDASWAQAEEALEYERSLTEVLEENGRAWADGNIRIGDYILIIDSDTRVPEDCLLDAVSEMEQSPHVGILQFSSGVMQVVHNYFENGITFFTNVIYTAINYCVSNGDVAPFVGHNAILRWSAVQSIGYEDEDGYEKFWSESHVSEDFEMALQLQTNGYIIRLASWANGGFKEGVSLTVYDELARWEKYAYGCNELLFNPIRTWLWKSPFTPLFRQFICSNISICGKITTISYIGTYYAIGVAWLLTVVNYFAIGLFNGHLDKYYLDSWKVWFSVVLVFNGLGNIALAVQRYRIGQKSFFGALGENIKWLPLLTIFFGGLSLHVSQALLAHMFEVDMSWGATSKEAEESNFFEEVPKILKRFKFSMIFCLVMIITMVLFARAPFIPEFWRITDFIAIFPMAMVTAGHFLLPIALNPALMTFKF